MSRTILFFLFIFPHYSFAHSFQVKARVIDLLHQTGVSYATIVVYNQSDSSYVQGGLTDSLGYFSLSLSAEDYFLEISHIAYQKKHIVLKINSDTILKDIQMKTSSVNLDEVIIRDHINTISHLSDKSLYRISEIPAAKSGSLNDALKTLPSISIDFNGSLLINGVQANIFIDGHQIENNELQAYTPLQIESIELISNPTSKFDADGQSGIISLKTKRNQRVGLSYSMNLTGTHDTQTGSGAIIYNQNKVSISSNLSLSNIYQHGQIETITNDQSSYNQVNASILNILANAGTEYRFSQQNKIHFSYQYINFGYTSKDFSRTRHGMTNMRGITHQVALGHHLLLDNNRQQLKTNFFYNKTSPTTTSFLDYFSQRYNIDNRNKNSSLIGMIDYTLYFTENATLEAGIKSHSRHINIQRTDDFIEKNGKAHYRMDESIIALYILMNSRMAGFNVQFGVRSESDLLREGDIRSWYLFPHLSLDHTNTHNNVLKVGYNSRINRPAAADLNPFTLLVDPTSQFQGDPNLKSEFSHNFYADYIINGKRNQVKLSTYCRYVKNLITKSYVQSEDNIILYKPINVSQATFYGANATASLYLNKKVHLSPNIGVEFVKLPSIFTQQLRKVTTLNLGLLFSLNLPYSWNISMLGKYSSGTLSAGTGSQSAIIQGLAIGLPQIQSEISTSKSLLKNSLSFSLRVTDPLNIQKNGFKAFSEQTIRKSIYHMQSRFIHVGLSYRFNNFKASKNRYEDGGILIF